MNPKYTPVYISNNVRYCMPLQIPLGVPLVISPTRTEPERNIVKTKVLSRKQIDDNTNDILAAVNLMMTLDKMQKEHTDSKFVKSKISKRAIKKRQRGSRCGECYPCLVEDCNECKNCLDKPRNGGEGMRKQGCFQKKCIYPIYN